MGMSPLRCACSIDPHESVIAAAHPDPRKSRPPRRISRIAWATVVRFFRVSLGVGLLVPALILMLTIWHPLDPARDSVRPGSLFPFSPPGTTADAATSSTDICLPATLPHEREN